MSDGVTAPSGMQFRILQNGILETHSTSASKCLISSQITDLYTHFCGTELIMYCFQIKSLDYLKTLGLEKAVGG